MADKVIHEVRFVETDDGFRIEVKGDKERMRQMGWDSERMAEMGAQFMGSPFGWGPAMRQWRRMWQGESPGGKHAYGQPGFGPWGWWNWWFEDEDETAEAAQPPKGKKA
ncbi:MAG: hypothetical protein R3351_07585 [Nitrospirales bacterium]|nr:hypothetical protein [Nitrospirales bacterium]